MSWNGLKKAINRAGAQVMLRTGVMDETVDAEYDFEEKRFRTMQTHTAKLHHELKQYKDSLQILGGAQKSIADTLLLLYGLERNHAFAQEYAATVDRLNSDTLEALDQPYAQTVVNPVARFNLYFIDINDAIKKRSHKKVDYDAMKNKVRRLIEKPDPSHQYDVKLDAAQKELLVCQEVYEQLNHKLKSELPQLVNARIPYLDPSFEAFVKIQLRYFNDNYTQLSELQRGLDAQTRHDYISGNLDQRLDLVLSRMRDLNITK